ncbi:MAG: Gar1/Naf1 family protein [Candidatus Bathyarchaeia archaeon]
MKRLGRVLHVSSNHSLILKAENLPQIGDRVVDATLEPVGKVSDVFGPVPSPYVAVKSASSKPQQLVENTLYTIPPTVGRKEKRQYGR